MTVFVPLDGDSASFPATPTFLKHTNNPKQHLEKAIKAITKARRVVVISGAGISTQAGIPDFRSQDGLFQSLKKDNPKELLSSGRDLFDASIFHSEHKTFLFYQMIARLAVISASAQPTPFHRVLKSLDDCSKLLRVYTQNIDSIECKSGLSFGIPCPRERHKRTPTSTSTAHATATTITTKSKTAKNVAKSPSHNSSTASRDPSPIPETPRCIPLHGTLDKMHCQVCTSSFPLTNHLTSISSGIAPTCPECVELDVTRQLVGKRTRGVGRLRPSVVLYNESHRDAEGVGEIVQKDLLGSSKGKNRKGADLLLVVGTSLKVPGTKRMVREFSKAVHARSSSSNSTFASSSPLVGGRRGGEEDTPIKSIYVNFDFPVPTRDWEGVFDAWVQGDVQDFAQMLQIALDKDMRAKELAEDRKRKREENALASPSKKRPADSSPEKQSKKRKSAAAPDTIVHPHSPPSPVVEHCSPCALATWDTYPLAFKTLPPPSTCTHHTPPSSPVRVSSFQLSTPPQQRPRQEQEGQTRFYIRIPPRVRPSPQSSSPSSKREMQVEDSLTPTRQTMSSSNDVVSPSLPFRTGQLPPTPDKPPPRQPLHRSAGPLGT